MKRSMITNCLIIVVCLARLGDGLPSRRLQQVRVAAEDLAAYRRAGCDNFTNTEWQPLRPGFHITVPYGWLNDPHGLFQMNGTTHMFFQYNPKALQWGAPFWAHVVSRDLARWTWLPPALLPDQPYDKNGVWSGSATIDNAGVPVLTYTAAGSRLPEMGFFQQQALAVPEDLNDPLLKRWRKSTTNPFLRQVPPGGTNFQFRDPTEAKDAVWTALTSPQNPRPLPKQHYALAVGNQAFCMGGAGIYTAPNMTGPWSYVGNLFNQLEVEPQINGQCMAPDIAGDPSQPRPAYGGPCDQFGAYCRMWEVVDFLELEPELFMVKWDDQSRFRGVFSMEWYVLGNGPWDFAALHPKPQNTTGTNAHIESEAAANTLPRKMGSTDSKDATDSVRSRSGGTDLGQQDSTYPHTSHEHNLADSAQNTDFNYVEAGVTAATKSLFKGELDGQTFAPLRTDYGSVYASTVFRTADGRQVMLSWIYDTAAGCSGSCSDELPEVIAKMGFKGVHTLPRRLRFDQATKTLRAYPVEEISQLRGAQVFNASAMPVATLPNHTILVPVGIVPDPSPAAAPSSNASNASITARQFEVQLNFTLQPIRNSRTAQAASDAAAAAADALSSSTATGPDLQPDEFALGLRIALSKRGGKFVDVYLKGSVVQLLGQQSPSIKSLSVWVDRSHAGNSSNTTYVEGGPVPLPVSNTVNNSGANVFNWLLPDQPLGLWVWIDHSVIEVFAMGGLARVTSRIYPGWDDVAWGLSTWAKLPIELPVVEQGGSSAAAGVAGDSTGGALRNTLYCWWCKYWFSTFSKCSSHCSGDGAGDGPETFSGSNAGSSEAAQRQQERQQRESSGASHSQQTWSATVGGAVWQVQNAWLPPAC